MWANYEHLIPVQEALYREYMTDDYQRQRSLAADALIRTLPNIRTDMLKHVEQIEKSLSHIGFSKISLCQANADWLAITLLKNVLQPHVRQRMMLDLVREGALRDTVGGHVLKEFINTFIALHLAAFGTGDRFDLFKACIRLIPMVERELVTADDMSAMETHLAKETSTQVFVGRLPSKYKTSELYFDINHEFNLNRPIKRKGTVYIDLRRMIVLKNTNRLVVRMYVFAKRPHITGCDVCLPVHFHKHEKPAHFHHNEKYVDTHYIPIISIECEVRSKSDLPSIQRLPCAIGTLPVLEWPEFCKTMNVLRRTANGLAVISVFLFYYLWKPRTRDRLEALVGMISSPKKNEVTDLVADVMSHYIFDDDKTAQKVRNKTKRLMLRFADAILLSNKLPFEVAVQYVSSTTLFSSKE